MLQNIYLDIKIVYLSYLFAKLWEIQEMAAILDAILDCGKSSRRIYEDF